jgi:MinD-like ATPase involved in chromosome partitioning or flagellar assembly
MVEKSAPDPAARPALVDELERMGFRPYEPDATTAEPAGPVAATAPDPGGAPDGPPTAERARATTPAPASAAAPAAASAVAVPAAASAVAVPAADVPAADVPAAEVKAAAAPPAAAPPAAPRAAEPPTSAGGDSAPLAPASAGPAAPEPDPGSTSLTAQTVLRTPVRVPARGWRRLVHTTSLGLVSPGPSEAERRHADLVMRATRPVPGCWRVAVLSLKGGVGKTTTTAALGVQLATLRGDRVIAVDANPDRGTLAEKVPDPNPATVRDLLQGRDAIRRYSDVRAFTSLSPSRLEVLASDADPTASQAFSEQDYRATLSVLEHFYSVILTDCGTGLLHSAMTGVLGLADALVVVTSANLDGARSASATLDWLEAHGNADLVRTSVAVVSSVRPRGGLVDVQAVQQHFAQRCRAVVQVPFDRHLEAGATVALEDLEKGTRQAYLELAAAVGDGLPRHGGAASGGRAEPGDELATTRE